jgi:hypothetical protein
MAGAPTKTLEAALYAVQAWKGQPQTFVVLRDGTQMDVAVTPHEWSGRGLLGCVMAPL